jgi:CO/xanthine dehydrogenase Mo-binding subunit
MNALTRREFLKVSAAAGGGLLIGFSFGDASAQAAGSLKPNAWVEINPDGTVVLTCHRNEMGQDVHTSLAMLLAEELEVDPRSVKVVQAGVDPVYINKLLGGQITGGSTSIRDGWDPLRQAGAGARMMLASAAAAKWNVPVGDVKAEKGYMSAGSNRASYGELAGEASRQASPKDIKLKSPDQWKVIGKELPRLDGADKARGKTVFGIDYAQPGMLYAALAQCPVIGGKAVSFVQTPVKRPGVQKVVNIGEGVAVIADHYWQARTALGDVKVTWDEGPGAGVDSAGIWMKLQAAKGRDGVVAKKAGDVASAFAKAKPIEATYMCQMLSHATLEPQNCMARVSADGVDIWASTQFPQGAQGAAAAPRWPARRRRETWPGGPWPRTPSVCSGRAAASGRR